MAAQDIRICYIGDSFVNGTGDESCLGWAGRLSSKAITNERAITHYNLGVRRNTSADILQRWDHECCPRLPDICDGRVVLSCGVNDMVIEENILRVSPEDSCKNVRHILHGASAKYKTIMVGPAPVADAELNSRLKILSEAYAQQAKALNIPFIEVFALLISDQQYLQECTYNDGFHPKTYGYTAIANIIFSSSNWWFRK
jgi:lysophospholipase L1-like esterase